MNREVICFDAVAPARERGLKLPLSSLIIKSFRKSNYLNCSLHLNVLLLNQIKTESEVINMVDSDTISLQIKNLYQTIFAVPLAQGVTWAV